MLFFVKVLKKLGLTITSSCFCSVVGVGGGGDGGTAADATGGVRLLNSFF